MRLRGAHVTGQLVMSGAELTNKAGPALAGDGLEVDGGLFLRSFRARGYGRRGVVRLWGAHVRGQLVLSSAELINEAGPALVASGFESTVTYSSMRGFGRAGSARTVWYGYGALTSPTHCLCGLRN